MWEESLVCFVSFPHHSPSSWGAHQDWGIHQPPRVSEEEGEGLGAGVDRRFETGGVG